VVHPTDPSASRTASGIAPESSTLVAARSATTAPRTSGREKNRSPPRSWYPRPARASASSSGSDCELVRYRIAISRRGTPWSTRTRTRAATPSASATSSSQDSKRTGTDEGRCASNRTAPGAMRPVREVRRRLARDTTWGVER